MANSVNPCTVAQPHDEGLAAQAIHVATRRLIAQHPKGGNAALRRDRAPGATTVSGFWGYRNDTPPHGDRILQVVRHVPLVTIVVAEPDAAARYLTLARETLGPGALITATGAD